MGTICTQNLRTGMLVTHDGDVCRSAGPQNMSTKNASILFANELV